MSLEFTYPQIYNFPPFFTRQPNDQTWQSQLQTWITLLIQFAKHHRIWILDENGDAISYGDMNTPDQLDDLDEYDDDTQQKKSVAEFGNIFDNVKLKRKLKRETILEIYKELITQGYAEWEEKRNSKKSFNRSGNVIIFWKRPEEWAGIISDWVESTGQSNSILTLYELRSGELSSSTEFHNIHPKVLLRALEVLVKRGKAQIMKDEDGQFAGVKIA